MKLHNTNEKELYYYFLKSGEKRFMYRHKYQDSLGRRKEKKKSGFKTEKTALRSLLEIKAAILNGQDSHIENNQITVSQWLDIWYETYSNAWAISSQIQRKRVINQYMKPLLGKYKLNALDKATYTRVFINELLTNLQPNTVQNYHTLFSISVNAAVDNEIIPRNRFTNIPFEQVKRKDNFLTPGELNIFLTTAKKHLNITRYTIVMLLTFTGIRHGELLGLFWGNIDFENNSITIESTRDHHGHRKPKTANSYRTIPVDSILINQLKKYQKWCVATKLKYGQQLNKEKDYTFITEDSEICSPEETRLAFNSVYKQFKKDGVNIKRITPHGMRHTHTTILINNGIPPQTVADRLGNSVEMVYKVYSHSFKDLEDKAVNVFSENLHSGANFGAK